ncbi:hypothetical protein ZIOFF_048542 [Zingiber officinale]|uniref:Uncharacterized protein n=1 Tax=Zingiber officinale TaxID=94328 RepID=A0A8J5KUD4_ZINOF|nr:hypothetical protein ZIOFF_048542 [Zingiber officinale]
MVRYGNFFSGSIPPEIGDLLYLQSLDLSGELANLSYNGFSGSIPVELANLTNLQGTLDLFHNRFSGSIPLLWRTENRRLSSEKPNPCGLPLNSPCPRDSPLTNPFLPNNYSPMPLEGNATHDRRRSNTGLLSKAGVVTVA